MNWNRKFYNGQFQHFSSNGLIAIFNDAGEWRFKFMGSVMCKKGEFHGYATSLHYWKTLAGCKRFLGAAIANGDILAMTVTDPDRDESIEGYRIVDGRIRLED